MSVVVVAARFVLVVRARFEVHEIVLNVVVAAAHVDRLFGSTLAVAVTDGYVQLVSFGDDFVRELLVQRDAILWVLVTTTTNQVEVLVFFTRRFVSRVDPASFILRSLVVVEPDWFVFFGMDLADDYSAHFPVAPSRGDMVDGECGF